MTDAPHVVVEVSMSLPAGVSWGHGRYTTDEPNNYIYCTPHVPPLPLAHHYRREQDAHFSSSGWRFRCDGCGGRPGQHVPGGRINEDRLQFSGRFLWDVSGLSMYGDGNPVQAAVAGALIDGHVTQARNFMNQTTIALPAAVRTNINAALASSTGPAKAAAQGSLLSQQNEQAAAKVSAVVPASVPAQAQHGETAATGLFYWLLHNSYHVPVYYGQCSTTSCTTGGSWDFTQTSNVFYSSTQGMAYSGEIYHNSGVSATLSGIQIRLFRDVSGGSDTDETSMTCPTSGSSFNCSGHFGPGQGNYQGHWYYLRLDETTHPSGYASSSFQMQTRRYLVVSNPSDWGFKSYSYYGN